MARRRDAPRTRSAAFVVSSSQTPPRVLPYGRQTIEDDDIAAVVQALKADFLTTGPTVQLFEAAFADATGASEAIACNSGTAALHLATLAIDLKPGQAAVVPTVTFLATANAVHLTGAEVVFADVDSNTGLLTAKTLEAALARAHSAGLLVKAVVPVHLNGQVCDLTAMRQVAPSDIAFVEDACHALGVDQIGDCRESRAACFSTHPVKAIATGEGGVVTVRDRDLANRMRLLRNHGMHKVEQQFVVPERAFDEGIVNPWYYEMPGVGLNYRMPDILCALGLSQLKKLPRFYARRKILAEQYDRLLAPLAPLVTPTGRTSAAHGWHLYAVLVDFEKLGMSRRVLMDRLRQAGIGSQVHYAPVHTQPYYARRYGALELPGAEAYYARCLSLPFYPSLSDEDVGGVVTALADAIR